MQDKQSLGAGIPNEPGWNSAAGRIAAPSLKTACALIFAIGIAIRFALLFGLETYKPINPAEHHQIARSLATHGTFENPYAVPTGPTAHTMPGYPLLLAFLYWLLGETTASQIAYQALNAVFVSLQYALLPWVASVCCIDPRAGMLAGLLGAVLPVHFLVELRGHEAPLSGLLLILSAWLLLRNWERRDFGVWAACLQGVCWGVAMLVTPSVFPVFCLFAALALLFSLRRPDAGSVFRHLAVTCVLAGLILLPWVYRNYTALGSLVVFRSNLGLELSISNNDSASPTIYDNLYGDRRIGEMHPWVDIPEARKVREAGEVAYNRGKMNEAVEWIEQNPMRFAGLTAERVLYFWFPPPRRWYQSAIIWVLTAAAFVGLVRLYRNNRFAALAILAIWLSFPLVYYLIQISLRYRYPMNWTFLLLAVYAVFPRSQTDGERPVSH